MLRSNLLNKRRSNLIFGESPVKAKLAWWVSRLVATIGLVFSLFGSFTSVRAAPLFAASLCGDGSAPDYGFSYGLLQPHWTVGWEDYASEQAVNRVDRVLDRLDEDAIAQTMILILPQDQVGIRTNCAVHFLRYMQLGLPTGDRKDNGFVFLIVVEPDSIDVHYAVGLGLPALTAQELTPINRATETTYQSTHNMDEALLTLADEFNTVARNNYEPEPSSAPTPEPIDQPSGQVATLALCGQLCLGIFIFFFLIWMFSQMGGGGSRFYPPGPGSWGGGSWGGGLGGFRSRGFPSGGGRSSPGPRMRGGSGSGRSGRTN
jgi:hypothetical protein